MERSQPGRPSLLGSPSPFFLQDTISCPQTLTTSPQPQMSGKLSLPPHGDFTVPVWRSRFHPPSPSPSKRSLFPGTAKGLNRGKFHPMRHASHDFFFLPLLFRFPFVEGLFMAGPCLPHTFSLNLFLFAANATSYVLGPPLLRLSPCLCWGRRQKNHNHGPFFFPS